MYINTGNKMKLRDVFTFLILINAFMIIKIEGEYNLINTNIHNYNNFNKEKLNNRTIRSILTNNNSKEDITEKILTNLLEAIPKNQNIKTLPQNQNNVSTTLEQTTLPAQTTITPIIQNITKLSIENDKIDSIVNNKTNHTTQLNGNFENNERKEDIQNNGTNFNFKDNGLDSKIQNNGTNTTIKYNEIESSTKKNKSYSNNKNEEKVLRFGNRETIPINNGSLPINNNPELLMLRTNVPWKHVSEAKMDNETEIVQICKFDDKIATCSADYPQWNAKLWFDFGETDDRNGINISTYERGYKPRVSFFNRVNATECQKFNNGTFHQICVKIYGYEKDAGPTRVCLSLGVAIFNHGVASTDFGCFRFGSAVRHEYPLEGEAPETRLLNDYILQNDYNNIINITDNQPNSASFSKISILLVFYITSFIFLT